MKKLLILTLLFVGVGCNSGKENAYRKVEVVNPIVVHDTIYLIDKPEVPTERYFMVSYQVTTKDNKSSNYGSRWFNLNSFPSKKWIDSIVYKALPLKRSCYQSIIVTSIFEFKSHDDFNSYLKDYKGTPNPKKQIQCEN